MCPKNLSLQFVVFGPWILVIQSKLLNRSKLRIVWSDLGPSSPSSDQNENWLSKIQFFGSKLAKESLKQNFRLNKFDFFPFMVGDFPEETFKNKMWIQLAQKYTYHSACSNIPTYVLYQHTSSITYFITCRIIRVYLMRYTLSLKGPMSREKFDFWALELTL